MFHYMVAINVRNYLQHRLMTVMVTNTEEQTMYWKTIPRSVKRCIFNLYHCIHYH